MLVATDNTVDTGEHPKRLDVRPEARRKIISQPAFLRFVKDESIDEILERLLRYLDWTHARPMLAFTASQSKTLAEPACARARR